jgi:hypothetical protein
MYNNKIIDFKMNLSLAYGYAPSVFKLRMSSQQRKSQLELMRKMKRHNNVPHWLLLDDVRVKIQGDQQLEFACKIVSIFHEQLCFDENDKDNDYQGTTTDEESTS